MLSLHNAHAVCVRACVRACVCAFMLVCACVRARMYPCVHVIVRARVCVCPPLSIHVGYRNRAFLQKKKRVTDGFTGGRTAKRMDRSRYRRVLIVCSLVSLHRPLICLLQTPCFACTLICLLACSLTHFQAHGKEVFVQEMNALISYHFNPLCTDQPPPPP